MKIEFLTVTELKQKASAIVHEAEKGKQYIITRDGKPIAILRKFKPLDQTNLKEL